MRRTIYDFLLQLKRRRNGDYMALTEEFRVRYTSDDGWCFAEKAPM